MTLTGREKEVIIINGANYYCYEIEDVVNTIPGVEPTFAGASSIEDSTTGTGGLAVFFTPISQDLADIVPLLSTIRSEVVTNIGINPAYIIPLARSAFAKTTSGKIQRTQMKKSLLAGEYDHILKQLDLHLRNQNTLPDWFFYKRWQPRQIEYQVPVQTGGTTIIFMDTTGLGAQLANALRQQDQEVVCVEAATSYRRLAPDHYSLDVQTRQHYHDLFSELQSTGKAVRCMVHLWNYGFVPDVIESSAQLEAAHHASLYSLLLLTQAFTEIYGKQPAGLSVVASQSQYVQADDELAFIRGTVAGFLKTVAQEMPWLHCQHLDLPAFQHAQNVRHLIQELSVAQGDSEVAYRDGRRLVPRLAMLDWAHEPNQPLPFVQGGCYILSGGLGGAGIEIARYLLQNYQARILLLGRSVLPERSLWTTHIALNDEYAQRLKALRMLEQLEGEISYVTLDIGHQADLNAAVAQAEQRWQQAVDGIFHLAGVYKENLLEAESATTLAEEIRAKVSGAWSLHRLVLQRPHCLFVSFSSVNGFFGGVSVGAYAAANSFLDSFVHYQRSQGVNSYCFAWSTWDETGMSAGSQIKELSQARGYYALKPRQALEALQVGLTHTQPYVLIGLDATNQNIRRYSQREGTIALQQASVFVQLQTGQKFQEQLIPANYHLVQLQELPVTPAGEIDLARLMQIDGSVVTERVAARTEMEVQLTKIWQAVLGVADISIHDNFFALGGDSILSLQIVSRANQAGLAITPRMLFQYQTIAHLAAAMQQSAPGTQINAQQEPVTGLIPLTPIQHWFFEQQFAEAQHWNQSFLLKAQRPLDPALLKQALAQLLIQHDALRMRFMQEEGSWQQFNQEPAELFHFRSIDLAHLDVTAQATAIEQEAAQEQASLDLVKGPLVRATYFDPGQQQPARFLLVIHHLIVDGLSWRILLEDLQTVYEQLEKQQPIVLPAKTTSFQYWSRELYKYAQSDVCRAELSYWLQQLHVPQVALPVDYRSGANNVGSTRTITLSLTEAETRALLTDVPAIYHTQMDDILLTALAQAMREWTGENHLLVNLEGHGREDIIDSADISRTIGWFTSLYPVQLDLKNVSRPGPMLKQIKEQLRSIPQHGIGYGLLRYLTEDSQIAAQLRQLPQPEVSFNYLGQFDQAFSQTALFGPAPESGGALTSPAGQRPHLLDIFGLIGAGQLHMSWTYSQHIHQASTIERFASAYMQALRSLIAHCQQARPDSYTLSDFPLARLSEEQLDSLTERNPGIESLYPLSPLQQGLLFHTLYESHTGDYVNQIYCTLQGSFDKTAFVQAWQIVVNHHPALRTALIWEDLADAHQIVYRNIQVQFNEYDWRYRSGRSKRSNLNAISMKTVSRVLI
ncbi:hypothetical protein KDW_43340 [Dictyobacter vulcani]|uniref:Carrier domain-containing protein n=1 Tax=Dictyobacter vulcani TaxID=2607529 RepID=A0A5J4KSR3_9CHLR|nr:SDR family NAD(P)-dependent oxidoreductase [Dictyobacter vulcani]GER90172.1 hypothetical protein KDW_43340 [Dictyobacter vulcani]